MTTTWKLTPEEVAYIRSLPYTRGLHVMLARRFKLNPTTIGDIRRGDIWRSVPGGAPDPTYLSLKDRFLLYVCFEPMSGCWLWEGSIGPTGYGQLNVEAPGGGRRNAKAHRLAWELFRGQPPATLFVLHRCDTPLCVNPDHLFLGTALDNSTDAKRKGRPLGRPSRQSA